MTVKKNQNEINFNLKDIEFNGMKVKSIDIKAKFDPASEKNISEALNILQNIYVLLINKN